MSKFKMMKRKQLERDMKVLVKQDGLFTNFGSDAFDKSREDLRSEDYPIISDRKIP